MNIAEVESSQPDSLNRRDVKVTINGSQDVRTAKQALAFGDDCNAPAGMKAIYAPTATKDANMIIGYINTNALAAVGERRLFSTDADGNVKFYIWLHNDGTAEIGGKDDNMVRYIPLNSGLQDFKTLIQEELIKIQTGIIAAGGAYTPGTLTVDISNAKIDEVKTLSQI